MWVRASRRIHTRPPKRFTQTFAETVGRDLCLPAVLAMWGW